MKLKNVHYEYRGNDIWRIYFKDALEADDFRNERTDGQKAQIAMLLPIFTNGKGVRYCVEAKLTGQFNILRYYAKDPTNDYFSNDVWRALVKKIEGADSDYIFDEIDLWYNATADKCFFIICCMNGTWTDFFVKNMLNSQFGMVAQANGYYDTDKEPKPLLKNITDVTLRTTKVIGCGTLYYYNLYFDDKSDLKNVNDKHINGSKLDSVKGTYYIRVVSYNKELPKNISSATLVWDQEEIRYSVEDFTIKGYRKDDKTVWISTGTLWSNDDYLARVQALTPPPVPYWAKLDDDGKIGFRQKEIDEMTKRIYEKLEIKISNEKEANNKEEKNMGPKDTTFSEFCRRLYWGAITAIKPTKVLVQGTATIIWWSDGTKTVVKCQKGDKMDPEKGIAMCVMKKFMGTNETHSNYLDFAKSAIAEYEKQQAAEKAKKKAEADKRRRAAAKKKGTAGNANYKRGTKAKTESESKEES